MGRGPKRQGPPGTKWCPGCEQFREIVLFLAPGRGYCKACEYKKGRARYAADPEKHTDRQYKLRYGTEATIYRELFEEQGGVCAACGRPERYKTKAGRVMRLSLDHDHSTGEIRGLLCHSCNRALGHLEENPVLIACLLTYAQKFCTEE